MGKKLYNDALECYKGLLLNNKNNAKAALGVLLASGQCSTFKDFIFNKYVGSDKQNELINTVIEYSKKDVTNEIFEQMIAFIKLEIEKADNVELAYKAYKEIKDFNSSEAVRKCHKEICDKLLKKKCFSNDACFAFIDDILLNCQAGYDTYVSALLAVINALIDASMFEKAGAYLKLLEKVAFGTEDYYSCLYRINSRQNTFAGALLAYINGRNIRKIADDIDNTNTDTANWILNNLINTILTSYTKISIDVLSDAFSVLTCYANPNIDRLTETLVAYCISEPSPEADKLFETILQSFSESRKDEFIDCIFSYAKAYMERSDFNSAKKYLNCALKYDRTNANLLNYLFYASIESIDETNAYRNLYKLKDFGIIEKILGLQKNDDGIAKTNAKFVEEAISYVSEYGKSSDKGIFSVFEQLIKYYPADCTDQLIKDLYNMADACKESSLFEEAEKYYALIVGTDSSEHAAYWGLLQAKLKCKSESEMIKQDVLINAFPELNNAITSAGNNKPVIEKYIDCSIKQQKYLEAKKRKRKNRKLFVAVSAVTASVLLVFCLVFSLVVNVFIPNSKYENAVSLINNREYYQAYEQLKDFDYADSSSQLSIAKAGMAFDRGDYEEGINCMYNVGGVTNINYDGNGGKAPTSSQTIKKLKSWVNNEPLYAGYSFYGWVIDSFSIKTKKNSYSCDLNLKATWKLVNYSISYALNGSTLKNKVETYNCLSQDFSLGQPKKKGYTFDGWSGTGLSEITKDVVVSQGSVGDRTYEAHFTAKNYNVTYDYGYDGVTLETTATYDSQFNVKAPSRDGYDFTGWTYNGKGFTGGIWNIDSDVTLIAHWKAKKYKISYDLNGGDNSPANLSVYTIETPTFTLSDPTKSGYDFVGWSGTGISGNSKDVAIEKGSIGNRKYTANWKAHTYIVNFDSNGGECSTSKMSVDYGSRLTLPQPTKTGYTLAGWFNAEDNAEVTDCTWKFLSDLNLYAKWNINAYTITYVLGGGVNDESNPTAYNVESDDITLNNPTRSGYTFTGWNSKLGNKQFNPTISQGNVGDLSFEATWEANLNTIVFMGNGYTGGDTKSQQAHTDSELNLNANGYTRDGYTFAGWSEAPGGIVKYYDQSEITVPTNSIYNLYAVWSPNLNTIAFNDNGADSGAMDAQRMHTDSTENLATNGFTKTGYHLAGWSTTPTGDVEYADEGAYKMGPNSSYDLYAKWEPNQYTLTYDVNGGTVSQMSKEITFDQRYVLDVPNRKGYSFDGWYMGDAQITDSNGNSLEAYRVSGNITATAHWNAKASVLVLIDGSSQQTIKSSTDSWISLPGNDETKENFIFAGWSSSQNGDVEYYDRDLYLMGPNSSYTLYAIWKDVSDYKAISTFRDLQNISLSGKYYLANDIDCSIKTLETIGHANSSLDSVSNFTGFFDGNGHTLFNLLIKATSPNRYPYLFDYSNGNVYTTSCGGLFGINRGTIRNLNVSNFSYDLSLCTGKHEYWSSHFGIKQATLGAIAAVNDGTIENCKISNFSTINTDKYYDFYIGSICGFNRSSGSVTSCSVLDSSTISGNILGCSGNISFDHGWSIGSRGRYGLAAGANQGKISNCRLYYNGINVCKVGWDDGDFKDLKIYSSTADNYGEVRNCYCGSSNALSLTGHNEGKLENNVENDDFGFYDKQDVKILYCCDDSSILQYGKGHQSLRIKSFSLKKDGYTFIGWSTHPNSSKAEYSPDDYYAFEANVNTLTLYPVWEPNAQIITFEADGCEESMESIATETGAQITLPECKFTKYGYHCNKWVAKGNISEVYNVGQAITVSKSMSLSPLWEPNENSIKFNANGGFGKMEDQRIDTDNTIPLNACSFTAPNGYYFVGWAFSPDGEVEYNDCSKIISNGTSVINLYAIWKTIE